MKTFLKWLNNPVLLAVLLALGLITDLILLGRAYDLSKSDWATWVGSVGTVATLAGTIWLATNDRRIRRRQEQDLALVTVAGLAIHLGEIEVVFRVLRQHLQAHVADGVISPYQVILDSLNALKTWQPADLTAMVCLDRHIAARIAFVGADIASIRGLLGDALLTPKTVGTVAGGTEFNNMLIPRCETVEQRVKSILTDCKVILESSGLNHSLQPVALPATEDQEDR